MFCPHCGKESAPESNFCSVCGRGSVYAASPANRIFRPRHPRLIAGVCSGFALRYGWDVTITRILFAAITFFTCFSGVLFYIAAWLLIPDAPYTLPQAVQPNP